MIWTKELVLRKIIIKQELSDNLRKTNSSKTKNTITKTGAEKANGSLPAPTGELIQERKIISIMTIILLGVILIMAVFIRRIILGIITHTSATLALQDGD